MIDLPNEIINLILGFRIRHPLFIMMKLTDDCYYKNENQKLVYVKDFDYVYDYTFYHWYFILVRIKKLLYLHSMKRKNKFNVSSFKIM